MSSMPVGASQMTGVVSGVAAATGHGLSAIHKGPEVVTTPLPMANPEVGQALYTVGAQPVGPPVSRRPIGDPMSHLLVSLSSHPAYAQRCQAPPVPV